MTRFIRIEELEDRIAPTVVAPGDTLTWLDSSGDEITVHYSGPAGSQVDVTDLTDGSIGAGDDIGWLTVTGGDYSSLLVVESDGGDIVIQNGVRSTTAGASLGTVALGVNLSGTNAGTVELGAGAQILSQGNIGSVIMHGNIDFDVAGQSIDAAGNIGLVEVRGNMTLDTTDGADIDAGTDGNGDVSFILVTGDVTQNGQALATSDISGSISVADDAGTGATGQVQIALSGAGVAGTVLAIPVIGGGSVVSQVTVTGAASVIMTGVGAGGDVTLLSSADAIGSVQIGGAADTDILFIDANGLGSVANRSVGGDIVGVVSGAAIGGITTGRPGVLGAAFSGAGNRTPLVVAGPLMTAYGTEAAAGIGQVTVGRVYNTTIEATSLAGLTASAGGITDSLVDISGAVGPVASAFIDGSVIYGQDGILSIKVGPAGIANSTISSRGDIASITTTGSITDSVLTTAFDDAGTISGGKLAILSAGSLLNSDVASYEGIDKIAVKGTVASSDIVTRFTDAGLGTVGAGIGSFSAASVALASTITSGGDIASVSIGAGGLVGGSIIDSSGSMPKISIKGDVADSSIINASGSLGTVAIGGDLAYDSRVATLGSLTGLTVNGQLVGSDVITIGDAGKIAVKGGITGVGVSIGVHGNLGSFDVANGIYSAGAGGTLIEVDGTLGRFNVAGGMDNVVLDAAGSVGSISAASRGVVYTSIFEFGADVGAMKLNATNTDINIAGNLGSLSFIGDSQSNTLTVEGTTGAFSVGGSVSDGQDIEFFGNVGTFSVKGDINNSIIVLGQLAETVTVGSFAVGGGMGSSTITAWGDVAKMSVKAGVVSSGWTMHGNVDAIAIGRGLYGSLVIVTGSSDTVSIGTSMNNASAAFYGGVGAFNVKGNIDDAIVTTIGYTAGGDPVGGAIGSLTALDMNGSTVSAFGGIGSLAVKGDIFGSTIETVGRDTDGAGAIVGGAGIGKLAAKGIADTTVTSYGTIAAIALGDEGVNGNSLIETVHASGNLGSLTTAGLIFGEISIAGALTGSVSTGGDAVALGPAFDFNFTDANGAVTGGTLNVAGAISGTVS